MPNMDGTGPRNCCFGHCCFGGRGLRRLFGWCCPQSKEYKKSLQQELADIDKEIEES